MRTQRRRRRTVSRRRREERGRVIRRRAMIAGGVLLLAALAMAPQLRTRIAQLGGEGWVAVQAFALPAVSQTEVTLPERKAYALQLGAYDNGEHAQSEQTRLAGEGVLCVIWQREQMRLICDAALSKGKLDDAAAQGMDVWVVEDTLPEVALRVSANAAGMEAVRTLLLLPDDLLTALCGGDDLTALLASARAQAQSALSSHPESPLYTQLAQSLVNWCALIESAQGQYGEAVARSYARVTMCTLCCELRKTLLAQGA